MQKYLQPNTTIVQILSGTVPANQVMRLVGRAFHYQNGSFVLIDGTDSLPIALSINESSFPSDAAWVGVEGSYDKEKQQLTDAHFYFLREPRLSIEQAITQGLPEAHFVAHPARLQKVRARARLLQWIRTFLNDRGFLEVQTPLLHTAAEAVHVVQSTTQSVDGKTLYLRTDPEEYLKRYLTAGLDAVYEIATNVRPDWPDEYHLQEFTSLEYYHRFWTFEDIVASCTDLIVDALRSLRGSTITSLAGQEVNLTPPFSQFSFYEIVQEKTGIDLRQYPTSESLATFIKKQGWWHGTKSALDAYRRTWLEWILDNLILPGLDRPTLIINFPSDIGLNATENVDQPGVCWRGEFYLPKGLELANFYVNLTEPEALRCRYSERLAHRIAAGLTSVPLDEGLLGSAELGMPPMAGLALGLDRLLLLILGEGKIGDGLLFPREGFL